MHDINTLFLILETVLILWAISHDFLARTIPNELNGAIFLIGIVCAFLSGHVIFALICMVIWFICFLLIGMIGVIGMGDVKLIPGVILCVNPNIHVQLCLVVLIAILGGLLGVYYLLSYWIIKLFKWIPKYRNSNSLYLRWKTVEFYRMSKKAGIPYGFAIGIAGIIVMWLFR